MSALISFDFDGEPVRAVTIDGEPHLVGRDVCGRLAYSNPTKAMNDHCRGVTKRYPIVDALGRSQEVRVLSEPDVLRLIIGSRLPAAQRFERWVFEVVLPEIRRTGRFGGAAAKAELDSVLALARSCELVRRIHGRPAAQRLWSEMGGMPLPVDEERAAKRSTPADEAPRSTASAPSPRRMRQIKDVRRFLRCCCRQVRGGKVGARTLHAAYAAWAPIVNAERLTQTMFGLLMRQTEIEREDGRRRHYLGLKLTDIAAHRMRHL